MTLETVVIVVKVVTVVEVVTVSLTKTNLAQKNPENTLSPTNGKTVQPKYFITRFVYHTTFY